MAVTQVFLQSGHAQNHIILILGVTVDVVLMIQRVMIQKLVYGKTVMQDSHAKQVILSVQKTHLQKIVHLQIVATT